MGMSNILRNPSFEYSTKLNPFVARTDFDPFDSSNLV